jgi:hypothetical protein
MFLLLVTHVLAAVAGLLIGILWRDAHPRRRLMRVRVPGWLDRLTSSRRAGIAFVLVAVLIQVIVATFLVVTRITATQAADQAGESADRLRQVLVCQVLHNTLTARGLAHRDQAAGEAREANIGWIDSTVRAVEDGTLTGPALVRDLKAWRRGLVGLDQTVTANPYPPGGLCDQLLQPDERRLLRDLRRDARGQ